MEKDSAGKGKITSEQALEILKKGGMVITLEQAKNILNLLTILAKLEVQEYFKKKEI